MLGMAIGMRRPPLFCDDLQMETSAPPSYAETPKSLDHWFTFSHSEARGPQFKSMLQDAASVRHHF
jgi:hypothetical protein